MIDTKKNTILGLVILDIISFASVFFPYTLLYDGFTLLFEEPVFQIMGLMLLLVYLFDLIVIIASKVTEKEKVYKVIRLASVATIIFSLIPVYAVLDVINFDFGVLRYGFLIWATATILSLMLRIDELFFIGKNEAVREKGNINYLLYVIPIVGFVMLSIFTKDTKMEFASFSYLIYYVIAGYYFLLMIFKNCQMDKILRLIEYVIMPILFACLLVVVMIVNNVWNGNNFVFLAIGFGLFLINEVARIGFLNKTDVVKND